MFSCEHCEIFMNTYFEEHLQTAASETALFPTLWTQSAFTCSKLTIETLEQGVEYAQS